MKGGKKKRGRSGKRRGEREEDKRGAEREGGESRKNTRATGTTKRPDIPVVYGQINHQSRGKELLCVSPL